MRERQGEGDGRMGDGSSQRCVPVQIKMLCSLSSARHEDIQRSPKVCRPSQMWISSLFPTTGSMPDGHFMVYIHRVNHFALVKYKF